MTTILDISKAQVYFDGIFSEPKLAHPEGSSYGIVMVQFIVVLKMVIF